MSRIQSGAVGVLLAAISLACVSCQRQQPARTKSRDEVRLEREYMRGFQGWGSFGFAISADGRSVAFTSSEHGLVPGDTNNAWDVVVPDPDTGQTERVSVASDGTQGDGKSCSPSLSADGRYVAFESVAGWESVAGRLVPEDSNGDRDVFVRDRVAGQTERVSVASDGTQGNAWSGNASISADGRYVAFASSASNLVPGDTNNCMDIFVRDRATGHTSRVSLSSNQSEGERDSQMPSISADGRHVAFESLASNLVPGDTNRWVDVFVRDRVAGKTERVSVASDGTQGNGASAYVSISADGRCVAFYSEASNLVPEDTNLCSDVFVHDRVTGKTERVSVASDGTEGGTGSEWSSLSAGGRFVAFGSDAYNLVAEDTNGSVDVFVHDRLTGETERVSVASDGTQLDWGAGNSRSISADGRRVVFTSRDANLTPGNTKHLPHVFVHDRTTRKTIRVSVPYGTTLPRE